MGFLLKQQKKSMHTRSETQKIERAVQAIFVQSPAEIMPKECDLPFCTAAEIPTPFGDNTNVLCGSCHKFTCKDCTKNTTNDSFLLPGVSAKYFTCPFCRTSFNWWVHAEPSEAL